MGDRAHHLLLACACSSAANQKKRIKRRDSGALPCNTSQTRLLDSSNGTVVL